jgi:lysine 2,3-aminomutase
MNSEDHLNKKYFIISENSKEFIKRFFPNISLEDWNNWHWQLKNRFSNLNDLSKLINLSEDELKFFDDKKKHLSLRITPYYASLLFNSEPNDPIRKTVVPVYQEFISYTKEKGDPLGEDSDSPVHGIVHRYPDRVVFLTTNFCSTNCRYCTRSRIVNKEVNHLSAYSVYENAIQYIRDNKQIRDVLLSGGDPLTLADSKINYLLENIRKIKHVEIIRIGTKIPVVLPQRITKNLLKILKQYHPLFINIHFIHPKELTPETKEACNRLADIGIPLGSQTVLLKDINDDITVMKSLLHELLKVRVRPYYIYQCDLVPGTSHLRTSVESGLKIMEGLRGHTTGLAVPYYVIDAPDGGGKIPLLPDYVVRKEKGNLILRNFEFKEYSYPLE